MAEEPKAAAAPQDLDTSRPADFEGRLATTSELPSAETLDALAERPVLDRRGESRPFRSLYSGPDAARRVLVVFVRHFFCGNCQEYLRSLAAAMTPEALLGLPTSTSIVVVGCGDPALMDMYVEATGCRFPLYTDPTRALFDGLGMVRTLAMGSKPAYMRQSMAKTIVESVGQALRAVPAGLALKSGDHWQVGGEFLFEPVDAPDDEAQAERKGVTWCHRMKTTRDHAEIATLKEVLGLDRQ